MKVKVYVMWHGGPSYAKPQRDDLEEFESLAAAKNEHFFREVDGQATVRRVGKEPESTRTPCVEDSKSEVYLSDPRGGHGWRPDYEITIGPRGGLRVRPLMVLARRGK